MTISGLLQSGAVRGGLLDGALRPKIVGLAENLSGPTWCLALVEDGVAEVRGEDLRQRGPTLLWRRWGEGARIQFAAGTVGAYVLIGASAFANAIGHIPEARDLRDIADNDITMPLAGAKATSELVSASLTGVLRELDGHRPAAQAVVEAQLRVVLIEIFRFAMSRLGEAGAKSASDRVFTRFSALVEQHFRDRWSVMDYAAALGVTRDRLGDICRRVRGRSPKDLIDRRVLLEAQRDLETSRRSVQEISGNLGFASPAQFSRFFARLTGQPPASYRDAILEGARSRVSESQQPFDWP